MVIKKAIKKVTKNASRKRVVFTLAAPGVKNVSLVGTFNNWDLKKHDMEKKKDGVWTKTVMLPIGKYEYKFYLNGEWWHDPANENVTYNEYGTLNSVITVT